MSKKYTIEERKIFQEYVYTGALVENVCLMLPERSFNAIRQQARFMGFGTTRVDGELVFIPIKRRRKRADARTATKSSTSATEISSSAKSIIPEKTVVNAFIQMKRLVDEESLGINSITVSFQNMTLSLYRDAS